MDAPHSAVLVIEDDRDVRQALCDTLNDEGYEVIGAENGLDALQKLQARALPGLIVMDLSMPVMSGWEFRQRQVQDPRLLYIPVVVVSADDNLEAKARAMGVEAYLAKPVDFQALLDTVSLYCGAPAWSDSPHARA